MDICLLVTAIGRVSNKNLDFKFFFESPLPVGQNVFLRKLVPLNGSPEAQNRIISIFVTLYSLCLLAIQLPPPFPGHEFIKATVIGCNVIAGQREARVHVSVCVCVCVCVSVPVYA